MIVKCRATKKDKTDCPMIKTCLARLTDRTITGCGIPLWYGGLIKRDEVMVEHTVIQDAIGCVDMRGNK